MCDTPRANLAVAAQATPNFPFQGVQMRPLTPRILSDPEAKGTGLLGIPCQRKPLG